MSSAQTAAELTSFAGRGAGTDAERRAAVWLARAVSWPRRAAELETFWCRPNRALAHAWHAALALAGSLVMVSHPRLGGAVVLVALLSVLADALTGRSLGRRLTLEHASQNVVSRPSAVPAHPAPVRLILTANYDAGRTGIVHRNGPRRAAGAARRLAGGLTPGWLGWLGWLVTEMVWLLVVAVVRDGGAAGLPIGIAQLLPTAALVLEVAALVELGTAGYGPAATDNASGTAVAIAVAGALDAAPPRHLSVELVLQGAGDPEMLGLRRHLRGRRRELTRGGTIVLGFGPCGAGSPVYLLSDGPLLALRYAPRLAELAAAAAPRARGHRSRSTGPAFPARRAGLPAITIGCRDHRGLVPRSHQPQDRPGGLDPAAMDAVLELALTLVDAIDAELGLSGRSAALPAAA
jgi:Peptidase family M28